MASRACTVQHAVQACVAHGSMMRHLCAGEPSISRAQSSLERSPDLLVAVRGAAVRAAVVVTHDRRRRATQSRRGTRRATRRGPAPQPRRTTSPAKMLGIQDQKQNQLCTSCCIQASRDLFRFVSCWRRRTNRASPARAPVISAPTRPPERQDRREQRHTTQSHQRALPISGSCAGAHGGVRRVGRLGVRSVSRRPSRSCTPPPCARA